jgi:hypothetical protein
MSEPDGFGPHVAVARATTKPSGWIFGQLFFVTFLLLPKESKKKEQNAPAASAFLAIVLNFNISIKCE